VNHPEFASRTAEKLLEFLGGHNRK
jgi:hypothetical protein